MHKAKKCKGQSVGSFGDVAAWSFCQDKIISTGGEGGMLTTNNKHIWSAAWSLKDHGKVPNPVFKPQAKPGHFEWRVGSVGSNYRMTELQAAIGRKQLMKLEKWKKRRNEFAGRIFRIAEKYHFLNYYAAPEFVSPSYYRAYLTTEPKYRNKLIESLLNGGIQCGQGACPEIYLETIFKNKKTPLSERLPHAARLGDTAIMFNVNPAVTEENMKMICSIIDDVCSKICEASS